LTQPEPNLIQEVKKFIKTNLLEVPPEIKKTLPEFFSLQDLSTLVFSTKEYLLVSFVDSKDRERINDLKFKNIHPYPALFKESDNDANAFFKLPDGARNIYIGKMTLQDGFVFSMGKDCTAILEEIRQSIILEEGKRYVYDIKLAYIISFGSTINNKNYRDFLGDLIAYSYKIWRENYGGDKRSQ
jgi:hypothetical protein